MNLGREVKVFGGAAACVCVIAVGLGACGKKGPPLAPLRLVPAPVSDVTVRRTGSRVALQFTLPTKNVNGPGRIDLARVEVYALTAAPGSVTPPNRELLAKPHLIGTIAVKPPPVEGEAQPDETPADTRPGPGDRVAFDDDLTADKVKPQWTEPAPTQRSAGTPSKTPKSGEAAPPSAAPPAANAPSTEPAAPAVTNAPPSALPATTYPLRIYVIRAVSRAGRPGQPSTRVTVPIVPPPAPPSNIVANFNEHAVALDWTPPVAEPGGPAIAFNIYRSDAEGVPLNKTPLARPVFEQEGVEFGAERCFIVRSVSLVQNVQLESDAPEPACVTAKDVFPPAPPKNLNAVPGSGAISLIWDANTEADLAGYIVLRAEAPNTSLQPLTPQPIQETSYSDKSVQSGVRYVYAVVAVDRAGNASQPSARIEETAR